MEEQNKFAIHAACRDGRGKLAQARPYMRETWLTSLLAVSTVESLLNVRDTDSGVKICLDRAKSIQADPKLAKLKDDDGRLPIHWACSANQLEIVLLLAAQKGFDLDVQVSLSHGRQR